MWFDSWQRLAEVALAAGAAYVFLVVLLRTSGKRTLAKLNAFDFVVTVAFGSTLATIAVSSEVAVTEGLVVLGTLVALQFAVAHLAARVTSVRAAVKSEPVAVLVDGRILHDSIRRQRLSPDELLQAVRGAGVGGVELVAAVVLETDGTLSVVPRQQLGSGDALPTGRRPR